MPKRERCKYVTEKLQNEFTDDKQAEEYVKKQTERKRNNAYKRYTRLWHKVYLQNNWNFFVTCTYSDEKHTEQTFQKTLRNTLKHLVRANRLSLTRFTEYSETKDIREYTAITAKCSTISIRKLYRRKHLIKSAQK